MQYRAVEILIVEDNEVDAFLSHDALIRSEIPLRLNFVSQCYEALNYIFKIGPFHQAATPDLILLDLKMDGMDGIEFLKTLQDHLTLKTIPIVIVSSSSHPSDIALTYQLNAIAYLAKPLLQQEIVPIIENLHLFRPGPNNYKPLTNR